MPPELPEIGEKTAAIGESITGGLRDMPWSTHGVMIAALLGGLFLWLFGRRFLRPGVAVLGAVLGGAIGCFLPPALGFDISPAISGIIGAVLGAAVGTILFRFAIALSFGLILAGLATLIAAAVVRFAPPPEGEMGPPADGIAESLPMPLGDLPAITVPGAQRPEDVQEAMNALRDLIPERLEGEAAPDRAPTAPERFVKTGSERVRAFLVDLWNHLQPHWNALGQRDRRVVMYAALGGALLGLLLGALLPKKATAVVTAAAGAGIWLPAAVWLLKTVGLHVDRLAPENPIVWAVAWLVLVVIGASIQWIRSRKPADKT